jgi:ParB-like chromosome segregation protein Spo0J
MRVKCGRLSGPPFMLELEPHPLAQLFPPISQEEVAELGRDIALHGQLEPIVLYQGKILDGVNRYKACRLMNREPWTIEFNPERVKRTPEEYVIAANVMRRHLTAAQRACLAADLAEEIEKEWAAGRDGGFRLPVDETEGREAGGRPRSSALPEAAQMMGVSRAAAYEARQIKTTKPEIFQLVKAGSQTLKGAMEEIRPTGEMAEPASYHLSTEAEGAEPEIPGAETEPVGVQSFAPSPMAVPPPALVSKPAAPRLSRKERIAGAWLDVERVFGGGKYTKWLRDGRLTDDEALEFEKLASDADKKQVRAVMLQNRSFREAVDSLTGLNPQNSIQDLHTRAIQSSGGYVGQIGEFLHVVAFGEKGRAELLERLAGWPAK